MTGTQIRIALVHAKERLDEMEEVLGMCEEYMDKRADAEMDNGEWVGNEEMRLLSRIKRALE